MIEQVAKAYLVEIENYTTDVTQKEEGTHKVEVQFNPETLKLSFANQNTGGDQPNGGSAQNVGNLTSQLSVDLLFDTTEDGSDVREKTKEVARFMMPKEGDTNRTPPRTRFQWGTFIFEGIIDGLGETLEYFSAEGVPMRAAISLTIKSDNIVFLIDKIKGAGRRRPAPAEGIGATSPLNAARPGDSLQRLAGRAGLSADWKAIAGANGIDDPLRLPAGALINLNVRRG
ncbi:MAG: LysM peptidoglycan-binding domain-containing protein [Chloroflexi bacterium]|nr:LysM peptidoglycan-binding domain-containing protein [Chloroflexota bacterium]MCI0647789.1 LysM peptidoglycan-binding domain-containing protein [Chloroflexota bacterium]MCI0729009.1 LysM peptidoglycan-binding domain-containing protein [Chloroflexota bacterium]